MSDDIAASNQRESDFFWGCNDGEDRREPRKPDSPDYMRGYNFGSRKWRKKNVHTGGFFIK